MPFKSDKQRKYLFSQKPAVAKKFAAEEKKRKAKRERPERKRNSDVAQSVRARG